MKFPYLAAFLSNENDAVSTSAPNVLIALSDTLINPFSSYVFSPTTCGFPVVGLVSGILMEAPPLA